MGKKVTIAALFEAYRLAQEQRQEGVIGKYGPALVASDILGDVLKNCQLEVELSDAKISKILPFFVQ